MEAEVNEWEVPNLAGTAYDLGPFEVDGHFYLKGRDMDVFYIPKHSAVPDFCKGWPGKTVCLSFGQRTLVATVAAVEKFAIGGPHYPANLGLGIGVKRTGDSLMFAEVVKGG